jgi:hypothetical protein
MEDLRPIKKIGPKNKKFAPEKKNMKTSKKIIFGRLKFG